MREVVHEDKKYMAFERKIGNIPLVIVKAKHGYVACSYIDKSTAEKVGDIAAFVYGVKNANELLKSKVRSVTSWAEDIGIRSGMTVKKTLEIMDSYKE